MTDTPSKTDQFREYALGYSGITAVSAILYWVVRLTPTGGLIYDVAQVMGGLLVLIGLPLLIAFLGTKKTSSERFTVFAIIWGVLLVTVFITPFLRQGD